MDLNNVASRQFIGQICEIYRQWINILTNVLQMHEVPKVQLFSEHILDRQLALYKEYKTSFPNIYKERVNEYLVDEEPLAADVQMGTE
jgi:hypothetical protein